MTDADALTRDDALAAEFSALHAEAAPRLWAWAAVRTGPVLRTTIGPEDVLQEVSCRAWRSFGEYDPERGPFVAWSLGIARKVLSEALSRSMRGQGLDSQWSTNRWQRIPDDATQATARVARDDHLAHFVEWVDALEEGDRRLLTFRGLEGWSHADVGELLGVSEETATKRWERLRVRLRKHPQMLEMLEGSMGG